MAMQTTKSALAAKYGARIKKVFKEHAHDEPAVGFSRLPPGIVDGRCQLVECKFETLPPDTKAKRADGKSAAGELQLRLVGVCVEPESVVHNGREERCAGRQSRPFPIPMYDTKNAAGTVRTFEDNVLSAMMELKKLGGSFGEDDDPTMLEAVAAALADQKPYFKLRTSVKPAVKNPDGTTKYEEGVWENWDGVAGLEDYTPPDGTTPVDDSASVSGSDSGPPPVDEYRDDMDLDSLLARANADDEAAQDRLNEMAAEKTGRTVADVQESTTTWEEVVELINAEAPAESEPFVAVKGEFYKYTPTDPKTKKPQVNPKTKKPLVVEVEATAVDKKTRTATILSNVDRKTTWKGVPFDALTPN